MTFLQVLGAILAVLVGLALIGGITIPWCALFLGDLRLPFAAAIFVASVVGLAALVTLVSSVAGGGSDDSTHCGQGTHYVSTRTGHGDGSTTWECVAL